MPDENGTDTTHPDAPSVDDGLFGDVPSADFKPATAVEGKDSTDKTEQDVQGSDNAREQDAKTVAAEDEQIADYAGEETGSPDELKVVVSIKGGRATIGVQRPAADPHIETFDDHDLPGLAQEVPAVIDRARARWEDNPKHPAYARPVPVRSRSRRGQGAAQATTAEGEEAQQATLGLF